MKMPSKKKEGSTIDFWQSAADLFLGLVLTLILIVCLFMLYVLRLPEYDFQNLWGSYSGIYFETPGGSYYGGDFEGTGDNNIRDYDDDGEYHGGDDGGGGSNHGGGHDDTYHEQYPLPISGGGGDNDWNKAAVYVTVIDAESKRAIREPGIIFELYQMFQGRNDSTADQIQGAIRYLYSYYPEKVEYKDYQTTDTGNFYLPEKIEEGGYYFKEITEPEGYDSAAIVNFNIDDAYDWNDPFPVSIALYPSRNVVRIHMVDAETGEPVEGGQFSVTAAEDIFTLDDTRRYVENEVVDTFDVADGYGESQEIYLGNYLVAQTTAPLYYTVTEGIYEASVEKKNGLEVEPIELSCEKTAITLHLTDDLYTSTAIEGARFSLSAEGVTTQYGVTDSYGYITFTNLLKNKIYYLRQESSVGDYVPDNAEYPFHVDTTGRINGEAKASFNMTNFVPRTSIGLRDTILKNVVSDKNISLYTAQGSLVRTWVSSAADEIFTDLVPGQYYIIIDNKTDSRYDFTVDSSLGINEVTFRIWTLQSMLACAAAAIGTVVVLGVSITMVSNAIKRRKRRD